MVQNDFNHDRFTFLRVFDDANAPYSQCGEELWKLVVLQREPLPRIGRLVQVSSLWLVCGTSGVSRAEPIIGEIMITATFCESHSLWSRNIDYRDALDVNSLTAIYRFTKYSDGCGDGEATDRCEWPARTNVNCAVSVH